MPKVCFFSIVSKNYTHVVRTLMDSIEEHYPEADRVVALCDQQDSFDYSRDNFSILSVGELDNIPEIEKFLFRYTILELNTAIKPYVIEKLFQRGYDKVFYIDPDIKVYSDLSVMTDLLDEHQVLLTPHLTGLLADEKAPSELDILRSGTYNLGYIGLRNTENTKALVKWWQSKLYLDCVVDLNRGLFVDQKWMDMVPGLFDGVYVQRHEGWNVAYWNLAHRDVTRTADGYEVNGQKLVFFHFSGFASDAKTLSKHQNRFSKLSAGAAVAELCETYASDLERFGADDCRSLEYAFGQFPDGTSIPNQARYIYRDEFDWQSDNNDLWTDQGAENFIRYLNEPAEIRGRRVNHVTRLAYRLYCERQDLVDAFPDLLAPDGINYAHWYVDNASDQAGYAECFISPMKTWLQDNTARKKKVSTTGFFKLLYNLARKARGMVRPFLSPEIRHRINLALIRRVNDSQTTPIQKKRSNEFGINLYGYVHAESGVGQSARSTIACLSAVDIPVSVVDVRLGNVSRMQAKIDSSLKSEPKYRINLFHINADQLEIALGNLGLDLLDNCYNIGFWAWELPNFPSEWALASHYLDAIWTPSQFCKQAIESQVDIPVHVLPHAVWQELKFEGGYLDVDIDFNKYTFCTMFDCLSVPERKNVQATIEAFESAFREESNVQLVIKVVNLENQNTFSRYLKDKVKSNSAIKLLPQYLDRHEIYRFLKQSDCFVSLHRSEGFGLAIAEAMLLEKPVITTNWSGNTDFCKANNTFLVDYELITLKKDYGPYKRGQTWAEPSVEHAAVMMKEVMNDRLQAEIAGQQASRDIKKNFSPQAIGDLMRAQLASAYEELVS